MSFCPVYVLNEVINRVNIIDYRGYIKPCSLSYKEIKYFSYSFSYSLIN